MACSTPHIYLAMSSPTLTTTAPHPADSSSNSYNEIDPSSVVIAYAITICVFPIVALGVVDPLLNQRSTLRNVLTLYAGIILAGYFAFPIWIFLAETRRGTGVSSLATLLTIIGISWNTIASTLAGPPKYKLLRNAPANVGSGSGGDRA